ncbi:MAG: glycosyltransferase, partial [Bacteroidota bacterium]
AYNVQAFIEEAIQSVIAQTHANWELLVIDNGSTDGTAGVIAQFTDPRIRTFQEINEQGVSAARNVGLAAMRGDYICFLDADDVLPPNSLASRLTIFQERPGTLLVDGRVLVKDEPLQNTLREYLPELRGNPIPHYLQLSEACFFGPTCMVQRDAALTYRFDTTITHGEDLLFYLSCARQVPEARYDFTTDLVLTYRNREGSAMSKLPQLERGYRALFRHMAGLPESNPQQRKALKRKITRVMFRSYLKAGRPLQALASVGRNWLA